MRKVFNQSFQDLVDENKKKLLNDPDAITKIEERIEERQAEETNKLKKYN
ncbi:FbpB family small basic protein [Desertibacillus haloalkaliphilus]|nr:FbpB family small basic protein [Desertibacillus haloalkaliphilus]MBU8908905.1 FbpB family small basic protein [Desertibacillus haloalkaliphilus]